MSVHKWKVAILDDHVDTDPTIKATNDKLISLGVECQTFTGSDLQKEKLANTICHLAETDIVFVDMWWEGMKENIRGNIEDVGINLDPLNMDYYKISNDNMARYLFVEKWIYVINVWQGANKEEQKANNLWPKRKIQETEYGAWLAALLSYITKDNTSIVLYSARPEITQSGLPAAMMTFKHRNFYVRTKQGDKEIPTEDIYKELLTVQKKELENKEVHEWFLFNLYLPWLLKYDINATNNAEKEGNIKPYQQRIEWTPASFLPQLTDEKQVKDILELAKQKYVEYDYKPFEGIVHNFFPWQGYTFKELKINIENYIVCRYSLLEEYGFDLLSIISMYKTLSDSNKYSEEILINKVESNNECMQIVQDLWRRSWAIARDLRPLLRSNLVGENIQIRGLEGGSYCCNKEEYKQYGNKLKHKINPKYIINTVDQLRTNLESGEKATLCFDFSSDDSWSYHWTLDNSAQIFESKEHFIEKVKSSLLKRNQYDKRGIPQVIIDSIINGADIISVLINGKWHELINLNNSKLISPSEEPGISYGIYIHFTTK